MIIKIDFQSSTPIFNQIMDGVRLALSSGRIKPGDKVPSIRELAVDLRINPNTVAKAYRELEREGVLEVQRGMGTFIGKKPPAMTKKAAEEMLLGRIDELVTAASEAGLSLDELEKIVKERLAHKETSTDRGSKK